MRQADAMDAAVARDRARLDQAEVLLEAGLVDGARAALGEALDGGTQRRATGSRRARSACAWPAATCSPATSTVLAATCVSATAAYRTRQAVELVREAELVRATIDVAAGHDLPAVVTELARRSERTGSRPARRPGRGATRGRGSPPARRPRRGRRPDWRPSTAHTASPWPRGCTRPWCAPAWTHARGRHVEAERRITTGNRLLAAHQFQSSSLEVRAALALHGRRLAALRRRARDRRG